MKTTMHLDDLYRAYSTQGSIACLSDFCHGLHRTLQRIATVLVRDPDQADRAVTAAIDQVAEERQSLPPYPAGPAVLLKALLNQVSIRRRPHRIRQTTSHRDHLARQIDKLPRNYRQVLRLHLIQHLESSRIAQRLAMPPEKVDLIIHEGTELLELPEEARPKKRRLTMPPCLPS